MSVSNRHRLVLLALLLVVCAAKLPTLPTPFFWDETGWIREAHRLAGLPLWHALPGFGVGGFSVRPPGLFLPVAILFKLFGPSIVLAHAVIAGFALVGVYFTYRLGALLYGSTAGVLAASFLFCNAIYFAQAGMFHADLPVAACGVASVYWMLRRRYAPFLFWALWLVLMKETALALALAISAYAMLSEARRGLRAAAVAALQWGLPLLLIGIFYAAQKVFTGRFFLDFTALGVSSGFFDPRLASRQVWPVTEWLFIEQLRWIFTALIGANLLLNRRARRRPELRLFLLIAVGSGYAFCFLYFLPRYLLPVAPYFFVLAAGALVELLPERPAHVSIAAGLVAAMIAWLPGSNRPGNREWDMGYLAAVRNYQAASAYLEEQHSGARILTTWPMVINLRRPELGYVTRPLDAVRWGDGGSPTDPADFDVIVDASLGDNRSSLAAAVQRGGWPLLQRFEADGFRCDIYDVRKSED
jgi:hypothetical protein